MPKPDEILDEHLDWAKGIARKVWSTLPPSFDLADLQQIALLETWERARLYDPTGSHNNVPFKGYAYLWVLNAVRMACRRRNYTDATSEALDSAPIDERPSAEDMMLAAEENTEDARQEQLRAMVAKLEGGDAYLVRRVYLEGVEVTDLAAVWKVEPGYISRRLSRAVRTLKRGVSG